MVLEIAAHLRAGNHRLDAQAGELRGLTNTRNHKQLRGVDDAACKDHLALSHGHVGSAAARVLDASGTAVLNHDAGGQRLRLDLESDALHGRFQIGRCGAGATSPFDGHL